MKKVLSFLFITAAFIACQPPAADPDATSTTPSPDVTGRSVLIYSNRQYRDTYEVTDYNTAGVPVRAKASVMAGVVYGVSPAGLYTSTIQLEYDALLRLKKSIQVYDQLGYASCCPGSIVFNPDRQLIHEFEYQGATKNITHEVAYSLNPKTGERGAVTEYTRRFTDGGQLMQEKIGSRLLYEASYDAQGYPLSETLYPDSDSDRAAFTRRWTNEYDANNRLLSRKINGSTSFEANTYDTQGRLIRQVSNLYKTTNWTPTNQGVYRLTVSDQVVDNLIDYSFRKTDERSAMSSTYVNGQFLSDDLRVATYVYEGEQTTVTNTTYKLWNDLADARQPGFDFSQIPKDDLRTIEEKKVVLNPRGNLLHEAFRYVYISDKLRPEQLGATYASEYRYTYDEGGNLTRTQGETVTSRDTVTPVPTPTLEARYKRF